MAPPSPSLDFTHRNIYKFAHLCWFDLVACMAKKTKVKAKRGAKVRARAPARPKAPVIKKKAVKRPVPTRAKAASASRTKVKRRKTPATPSRPPARSKTPGRQRSKRFASALQAYETAIKLMHTEEFVKAKKCLEDIVAAHPEEPEIQERAKVLISACEKKIQEKAKTVLRSADDLYNVGIAELNSRALDSAVQHLQHALKLTPKSDHVLYALAAANALQGNREQSLQYLKQSLQYRPENRFLALRDSDFEALQEDPDFKQLVKSPET